MFVSKAFKEGIVYSPKKGTIYTKISFSITTQDIKIYDALKEIAAMIVDPEVCIKINYTQDKILDKKPESPTSGELGNVGDVISETIITVPKFAYIISNIILLMNKFTVKSWMVKIESIDCFGRIKKVQNIQYH